MYYRGFMDMDNRAQQPVMGSRGLLTLVLVAAFAWSLLSVPWGAGLFHPGGLQSFSQMVQGFLQPDLSWEIVRIGLTSGWQTLAYATAGMTVALLIALPLGVLASGVLFRNRWIRLIIMPAMRSILGFLRAIHELVWAWLFVAAIGLSPYAAILALGLPYGGILGRIFADFLNDVPAAPLTALRNSGASEAQVFFYGRLPMAMADMLSYTMYRFECAVRSAAILSFVGLGGLGHQIQISLEDLRYNEVATFLFFLISMVIAIDLWSNAVRRRLVA